MKGFHCTPSSAQRNSLTQPTTNHHVIFRGKEQRVLFSVMDCNVIPSPLSPLVSVEVNGDDSFAVNSLFVQLVIFDGKQHFRAKHSTIELTLIEHISEYMPVVIEIVAFDPMLREEAGRLYLRRRVDCTWTTPWSSNSLLICSQGLNCKWKWNEDNVMVLKSTQMHCPSRS